MEHKAFTASRDSKTAAPVRSIVAVFREFEQVAKYCEMNLTQYRILLFLRNGPRRAGEIAATSFVAKPTMSFQIASLRAKGWIAAETDTSDRRVSRIVLTGKGRSAMDLFEAKLLRCLESLIGAGDKDRIVQALTELYLALGATRESRFQDLAASNEDVVPVARRAKRS